MRPVTLLCSALVVLAPAFASAQTPRPIRLERALACLERAAGFAHDSHKPATEASPEATVTTREKQVNLLN